MKKIAGKNFLVRTLSGAILLLLVLGAVLLSEYTFLALVLAICAGSLREFYTIAGHTGTRPQSIYGITAGAVSVAACFFCFSGLWGPKGTAYILALLLAVVFIPFVAELYRKQQTPLRNIAVTVMGLVYVALPLSLLVCLSVRGGEYRPWVVLAYIFIIWANDVGAYLVGVTIGKHRLFERISPKKSWEGFAGGLIFAVGAGILSAFLLKESMLFWGGLSLVSALGGVLGDLVESLFKRSVDIKDSGSIMPGHGGFLDRFDALILSLPAVFIYFVIFAF